MTPEFWRGKRVLLTGHTGFKGSWLCLWLEEMGAHVLGYSLEPPSEPNMFSVAEIGSGIEDERGDIRDLEALKAAFAAHQPEIVLHLAAQSLVKHSYDEPLYTYSTNVMGTVNVLEVARHCASVRVLVNVTSDKCYANREWLWGYREEEAMGGHDPYSSSKGCAELVTAAYRASYWLDGNDTHNIAAATARAGNVIGGGDWAKDRLVPDLIRAVAEGTGLLVRSPASLRPWQHVLEPLSGYLLLAERLWGDHHYAQAWNFGPPIESAKPVSWIADRLTQLWQGTAHWRIDESQQPHEAKLLMVDSTKARILLGWKSRWNLDQALVSIVEWHQAFARGESMREVTLQQINAYMASN